MKLTIDRIEGIMAVVMTDEGKSFDVPAEMFPDIKEGNVYNITIDEEEKKARMERIKKLAEEIWE